jgi:hypothetical protein
VLFTLALVRTDTQIEHLSSHKAMVEAWSSLATEQVYHVFVAQHSQAALFVDKMARVFRSNNGHRWFLYNKLPLTLQRNPVVALAALELRDQLYIPLPKELSTNKQFLLRAISQTRAKMPILGNFSYELRNDEQVVLQAVARFAKDIVNASIRLRTSKVFVLQAVSVNGLCINWVYLELGAEKEIALAAVRQNKEAFRFLCDARQEDKDIQEAYRS